MARGSFALRLRVGVITVTVSDSGTSALRTQSVTVCTEASRSRSRNRSLAASRSAAAWFTRASSCCSRTSTCSANCRVARCSAASRVTSTRQRARGRPLLDHGRLAPFRPSTERRGHQVDQGTTVDAGELHAQRSTQGGPDVDHRHFLRPRPGRDPRTPCEQQAMATMITGAPLRVVAHQHADPR